MRTVRTRPNSRRPFASAYVLGVLAISVCALSSCHEQVAEVDTNDELTYPGEMSLNQVIDSSTDSDLETLERVGDTPFGWAIFTPSSPQDPGGSVYFSTNRSGVLNVTLGLTNLKPGAENVIYLVDALECRYQQDTSAKALQGNPKTLRLLEFTADDNGLAKAHIMVTKPADSDFSNWKTIINKTIYLHTLSKPAMIRCTNVVNQITSH